ncbi:MAG: DUF485 domain-containing protein [Steroidobacteraceae bacterium]
MSTPDDAGRTGWIYTALAIVPCFAYILSLSYVPQLHSRPLHAGSLVSLGLVLGLALAAWLVLLALLYTRQLNRREAPA